MTARSWAVYCKGALYRIDSFDSDSAPPCADELVVIETFVKPSIDPVNVNVEAPLDSVLFVTMYSSMTILPSDKFCPSTPSPKYT